MHRDSGRARASAASADGKRVQRWAGGTCIYDSQSVMRCKWVLFGYCVCRATERQGKGGRPVSGGGRLGFGAGKCSEKRWMGESFGKSGPSRRLPGFSATGPAVLDHHVSFWRL